MKKIFAAITILALAAASFEWAGCAREHAPEMSARQTLMAYNDASNAGDTTRLFALCTSEYAAALRPTVAEFIQSCMQNPSTITIMAEDSKSDTEARVAFKAIVLDATKTRTVDSSSVLCTLAKRGGEWKVKTFSTNVQVGG